MALAVWLSAGNAEAGQYEWKNFDFKDYALTQLNAISRDGEIAGSTLNSGGGRKGLACWSEYRCVHVSSFYPTSGGVELFGINDNGLAVGRSGEIPFEYDLATGGKKFIRVSHATLLAVNDSGVAVGGHGFPFSGRPFYSTGRGLVVDAGGALVLVAPVDRSHAPLTAIGEGGRAVGFATSVNLPPTLYSYSDRVRKIPNSAQLGPPVQVDPDGAIIGNVVEGPLAGRGYRLAADGQIEYVIYPGADFTTIVGTDSANRFYGVYGMGTTAAGSFVFDGTTYSPLSFPGASLTLVRAVNGSGHMVGSYTLSGTTHAFLATCLKTQRPCTE